MNVLLTLVAMFRTLVVQFVQAPHWVEDTIKVTDGQVEFITGNGAALSYVGTEKNGKTTYCVKVQVPAGPGLREPAFAKFADNETRDKVASMIKEAYSKLPTKAENGISVVIPEDPKG